MVQQQQIRVWRARLMLSQEEIARETGISQARMSRAEHGLIRLSDEEITRIHEYITRKRRERQQRRKTAV